MGTRSACITTLMEQEAERRRRAPRPYENWTTARIREEIERSGEAKRWGL